MNEGKIIRVSGPLVIAEGLPNSKMYDLVYVGQQRLVGEIIELRGGKASIQVYEETAGLGPGDPVVTSNAPLSVELGPGLIGSIYDGIQRPLEILKEKSGSFLERGLTANALDRERKWAFKPIVKAGQTVKSGDILGVVKETEIIEHKIMVPPKVEGEIVKINEGEFTVEQTVAEIKLADGQILPLNMIQRWPVRVGRPYEKKLPPSEPLVTGQRVIDTFFPLTKGGTACVPGPFGAGKCVSGDTPVLLANGRLAAIKDIFREHHGLGRFYEDKVEAYTLLDKPLEVFSFVDGQFKKAKATVVYKGFSDELVKITTVSGRVIKVTPIHRLYKINSNLNISEVEAQHLNVGDYLAAPRQLEITDSQSEFNLLNELKDQRVVSQEVMGSKRKILKYLGFPEGKNCVAAGVPPLILAGTKEVIGEFLGAYLACHGYFQNRKGEIEISISSKQMLTGLSYLLLRLGILFKTRKKVARNRIIYKLIIPGQSQLTSFYQSCAANRPSGLLKKAGVKIPNHLSAERLSHEVFKQPSSVLQDERLVCSSNHFNHIFADKIVAIERIAGPVEVFDLHVPGYHNFIGGHTPAILHNTVIQHEIAKWSNAQIIIFIGCGERGNEMTDVLIEFPQLIDPYSGRPLMERTVLIANTSNMPVAAREASIYTGIAIAEYFRDMGYDVALQADSTSRWAEALREISGRLEEMPGEEGYPAYLSSRLAAFYERAGAVSALGSPERVGSVTAIGSVSPPGGDLSEPVVQSTLRVVKVFWALEDRLAYERHFPAINWLVSYSLYLEAASKWLNQRIAPDFQLLRNEAMRLLQIEAELKEIVRLVGLEALSLEERVILETARSLREDFLQQNAFHEIDTFCSLEKQYFILKLIMKYHTLALKACLAGRAPEDVATIPAREKIARAKYIPEKELKQLRGVEKELEQQLQTEEVELHG